MDYVNPFQSELALEHSSYSAFRHGYLVNLIEPQKTVSELAEFVHGQFYALTMDARFSCVAARSAFRHKTYRFAMYPELNSAGATAGLCRDLFAFVQEQPEMGSNFTTFVASFAGPNPTDEKHFEKLLWQQLQRLHEQDTATWDGQVSSDPESGHFSFSFAGRAFFIVGLHAGSSRWVRRFAWPTLVFNTHAQFEHLRDIGKYTLFQKTIRGAEHRLQGSINPSLRNFSEESEAAQYSGRAVEESWKCPFTPREKSESYRLTPLVVHEDAFELGIMNPVAGVIDDLKVLAGPGELDEEIEGLEQELSLPSENYFGQERSRSPQRDVRADGIPAPKASRTKAG